MEAQTPSFKHADKEGETSWVTRVKASVDLVALVGQYVVLKAAGVRHMGLCPFHSERTPSFMVHAVKQFYYCYGCKQGGDALHFVMQMQGCSFQEALEELASQSGLEPPAETGSVSVFQRGQEASAKAEVALALKLNRFVAGFYHKQWQKAEQEGSSYWTARGVSLELGRLFYVGLAPSSWEALTHFLKQAQAPLALAEKLGLIHHSVSGQEGFFDTFRGRALFPLLNLKGQVVGFGGRLCQGQGAKYLNSVESFLFQKSRFLFGLYQAQKFIREADQVIVVEGYFDVLSLHAVGIRNVVALCGTTLSEEHLKMLQKLASRILLLLDGDAAGKHATEKAMEFGLKHGLMLYGATLPEGKDPDLFIQETGEPGPLLSLLAEATRMPLLDRQLEQRFLETEGHSERRVQAIQQAGHWLSLLADPLAREVRLKALTDRWQIAPHWWKQVCSPPLSHSVLRLKEQAKSPQNLSQRDSLIPGLLQKKIRGLSILDRRLLVGLFQQEEYRSFFQVSLAQKGLPRGKGIKDLFESPAVGEWLKAWVDFFPWEKIGGLSSEVCLEGVTDQALKTLLIEIWMEACERIEWIDFKVAVKRSFKRLWAEWSMFLSDQLKQGQREAVGSWELQSALMKEYLDVQKKIKELSSLYDEK